ncbi:MAG: response regulator [Negativicutes bacterium]|nr:response regulator [Negativicutes bacterium]
MEKRILLVDDSLVSLKLTGKILAAAGYAVAGQLSSADRLVETYERLKPDLVLMDVYMPGVDGFAGCRQLREKFPDARVVFLSSMQDEIKEREAIALGAVGYLQKPVAADKLQDALRAAFGDFSLFEALAGIWPMFAEEMTATLAGYGISARPEGDAEEIGSSFSARGICALIGINGLFNGSFALDVDLPQAREIARRALDEDQVSEAEAVDMVGELANVVAGAVLSRLNAREVRYNFRLSPPAIYYGADSTIGLPQVSLQLVRFSGDTGRFTMAIGFKKGAKEWMST